MPLRKKTNRGKRSRKMLLRREKKGNEPTPGDAPVASTSTDPQCFPPPVSESIVAREPSTPSRRRGRPTLPRNIRVNGFEYDPDFDYASITDLGNMDRECPTCRARKWPAEVNYHFCCSKDKVKLPPESLKDLHEKNIRPERLGHLRDASLSRDTDPATLGAQVDLPASSVGGSRHTHERSLDAHVYLREFGCPDMFVTLVCNLDWEAISQNLEYSRNPAGRLDIVVRVFRQKMNQLVDQLTRKNIFGQTLAHLCSVEWRQNGLPQAHVLVWLRDKISSRRVDDIICAEIPDPSRDPELYRIVTGYMMHDDCGTACKRESPCIGPGGFSEWYPREHRWETFVTAEGNAVYRRRREGNTFVKRLANGVNSYLGNSWVIPYSPVLCRLFQAHVRVQLLAGVRNVKYLCEYLNKASGLATIYYSNGEVIADQNGHVSTYEAIWRLLRFKTCGNFPPVERLAIHLECQQPVISTADNAADKAVECKPSTLVAFFDLCSRDDFARTLLYTEVPAYYRYDTGRREFVRRVAGRHVSDAAAPDLIRKNILGRLYTVTPSEGDKYYLRLLLTQVRGPTSFEQLRTVDGILQNTYRDACTARGLLRDDTVWENTLRDAAAATQTPSRLRDLFAMILVFCSPSRPAHLWETCRLSLSEDEIRRVIPGYNRGDSPDSDLLEAAFDRALSSIEMTVFSIRGRRLSEYGMPSSRVTRIDPYPLFYRETHYDAAEIKAALSGEQRLSPDQRGFLQLVMSSVKSKRGNIYFLSSPAGAGKSFVLRVLLAKVRSNGGIALAVASTDLAASLLPGGRSAHSMFRLPTNLDGSILPIDLDNDLALVLQNTQLIVWDNCAMSNNNTVETVDGALRFIRNKPDRPMGDVTTVLAGDFRQFLPVVRGIDHWPQLGVSIKGWRLWRELQPPLRIEGNARVSVAGGGRTFADRLLKVGEGWEGYRDSVQLTDELCRVVNSIQELIDAVYPPDERSNTTDQWLTERVILTPRNDSADYINALMTSQLEGDIKVYKSVNHPENDAESAEYPVEFLGSLGYPGFPPPTIKLKVGVPVICLQNLLPPYLVEGTRCVVVSLQTHSIGVRVLTAGPGAGLNYTIPRVSIQRGDYSDINFTRKQLPVAVCYAMTIEKSQGQTFKVAGVDLTSDCFTHGQLYAAFSRVGDPSCLFVLAPGGCVKNIVHREIFCG